MPLHNVIPLCNFKYVGDTLSSATFKYDTTEQINKTSIKLLECESKDIVRSSDVLLQEHQKEIEIETPNLLYGDVVNVNKNDNKLLQRGISSITKECSQSLNNIMPNIIIEHDKNLLNDDASTLNKYDFKNLDYFVRDMIIIHDKNLGIIDIKKIDKLNSVELSIMDNKIITLRNSHIVEKINTPEININNGINLIINDNKELQKNNDLELQSLGINTMMIDDIKLFNIESFSKNLIYSNMNKVLEMPKDYLLHKCKDDKNLVVLDDIELAKPKHNLLLYRINSIPMVKDDPINYLDIITNINISIDNSEKFIYRIDQSDISQFVHRDYMNRINMKSLGKAQVQHYFYKDSLKQIFKDSVNHHLDKLVNRTIFDFNGMQYLTNETIIPISPNTEIYLNDESITRIFKGKDFNLDHSRLVDIIQYDDKPLLSLDLISIYKKYNKHLGIDNIREVSLAYDNKFIEVTKRWWWLNETNPKDHLIVPNKDYGGMIDLLSNLNYEYLRYNNHPLEWGKDWGVDWNIPPCGVSINIMLDLVNIINMIWHKNVQGWLMVSGKESMQLLIELLYDWYTMNSSMPNTSYYRAYRWIRWEAEKVYFLDNIENGLQAIGILVANLRNYLKIHHFNNVPIWRNPKSMDEERNFNRCANANDLMKELDKIKGKRHYLIETQNFEKRDLFK